MVKDLCLGTISNKELRFLNSARRSKILNNWINYSEAAVAVRDLTCIQQEGWTILGGGEVQFTHLGPRL